MPAHPTAELGSIIGAWALLTSTVSTGADKSQGEAEIGSLVPGADAGEPAVLSLRLASIRFSLCCASQEKRHERSPSCKTAGVCEPRMEMDGIPSKGERMRARVQRDVKRDAGS